MARDVFVVIRLSVTDDDDLDDDALVEAVEDGIDQGEITVDGLDVGETEVVGVYAEEPKPQ